MKKKIFLKRDFMDYSLPCKLHPETVTHKFRTASGITLVALVVTIIILLILAGVSLNLVAGSNGILGKAKNATEISKLAATKEQLQLDLAAAQMDVLANGELEISQKNLTEIVSKYGELQEDGDTIVTENGDISLKEIYQKSANEGDNNLDISGGETIDSTEVSKLVAEMQNLKTEVNTLKTANDAMQLEVNILKTSDTSMQSSITALRDSLFPTSYITPTAVDGVGIYSGGYYQVGNTVYVNMDFRVEETTLPLSTEIGGGSSGMTIVMSGFPIPAQNAELDWGYTVWGTGGHFWGRGSAVIDGEGKMRVAKKGSETYISGTGTSVFGTYLAKE